MLESTEFDRDEALGKLKPERHAHSLLSTSEAR